MRNGILSFFLLLGLAHFGLAQTEMCMPNADSVVNRYYSDGQLQFHVEFNKGQRILIRHYFNAGQIYSIDSIAGDLKYHVLYHTNGKLREKGAYKDEQRIGEWTVYHSNGQLHYIDHLNELGETDGEYISFYDNGQLNSKYVKRNGTFVGELLDYYANGQLERQFYFLDSTNLEKDTTLHVNREFFEDGSLKFYVRSEQGKWVDTLYAFHENGRLHRRLFYNANGNADDLSISYFSNGRVEDSVRMVDGKKEGEFVRYHENGQLAMRHHYLHDQKEGIQQDWYANGQVASLTMYSNLKPDGEWFEWFEDGQLNSKKQYSKNVEVGEWIEFHSNGQLKSSKTYVEGKVQGKIIYFYKNGQVNFEGTAKDDKFVGEFKSYDEYGQLSEFHTYRRDHSYTALRYYSNGRLALESHYDAWGAATGTWYWYKEDGTLEKKKKFR